MHIARTYRLLSGSLHSQPPRTNRSDLHLDSIEQSLKKSKQDMYFHQSRKIPYRNIPPPLPLLRNLVDVHCCQGEDQTSLLCLVGVPTLPQETIYRCAGPKGSTCLVCTVQGLFGLTLALDLTTPLGFPQSIANPVIGHCQMPSEPRASTVPTTHTPARKRE